MENKLKMELNALPVPETAFEELEALTGKLKPGCRRKKTVMILAAAVLALLLCGMGWAKASMRYGLWHLIDSRAYSDLARAAKKYDVVLPEALDGVPFCDYSIYSLANRDDTWLEAVVNPAYTPRSVTYGYYRVETETHPGGSLSSESRWTESVLELDFGTTENDLWRYYFKFDGNDSWTGWNVPGSYETVEYKGIIIQAGTLAFGNSETRLCRRACWIDEEKQVAFCLREWDFTDPNRVVECAKQIIDLNSGNKR